MAEKMMVRRHKGRAHLSSDDRKTFCGLQISRGMGGKWSWTVDHSATPEEFIKNVHPACSKCKRSARIVTKIEKLTAELGAPVFDQGRAEVEEGDLVCIRYKGVEYDGTVQRAVNYGTKEKSDWYIEMIDRWHNPMYWKQGVDGGDLLSVTKAVK